MVPGLGRAYHSALGGRKEARLPTSPWLSGRPWSVFTELGHFYHEFNSLGPFLAMSGPAWRSTKHWIALPHRSRCSRRSHCPEKVTLP